MSICAVGELCYYDYLVLLRDAIIYTLQGKEKGREYLEKCWILEQTEPDRKALRKRSGKE